MHTNLNALQAQVKPTEAKSNVKFFLLLLAFFIANSALHAQEKIEQKKMSLDEKTFDRFMKIQLESLAETQLLDARLNASNLMVDSVFKRIIKEYGKDQVFVTNLTESQKIWKMLKQANIKALYPNEEPNYYGQVNADCVYMRLLNDNQERLQFLEKWLIGIPEGDVCAGSIKMIR